MDLGFAPIARGGVLLVNFAWFGAAFLHFGLRSRRAFINGIHRQPGEASPTHVDHAADVFKYLGAMNGALSLSTLPHISNLLLYRDDGRTGALLGLFWLWGAAHASQSITTLSTVAPTGRWRWEGFGLGMITYVDTLLWGANWLLWRLGD